MPCAVEQRDSYRADSFRVRRARALPCHSGLLPCQCRAGLLLSVLSVPSVARAAGLLNAAMQELLPAFALEGEGKGTDVLSAQATVYEADVEAAAGGASLDERDGCSCDRVTDFAWANWRGWRREFGE